MKILATVLFLFSTVSFAATKSTTCPLQKGATPSQECLEEMATALDNNPVTVATRNAIESSANLEACNPFPASELRWEYLTDQDLQSEVGPIMKLNKYYECDPASGYTGYAIAGRYYLNPPQQKAEKAEFIAIRLLPID